MSKKKIARGKVGVWVPNASFALVTRRDDGRHLSVNVSVVDGRWCALAVEATSPNVDDVLNSHAHDMLGVYDSPVDAMAAAESYTVAWLKGFKVATFLECPCAEIA